MALQDIKTIVAFDLTRLDNTLYVGTMTFTQDAYEDFFGTDASNWPTKLRTQYLGFKRQYVALNEAFVVSRDSLLTPEIKAADEECDQLVIGIRQVAEGISRMSFNAELQKKAVTFLAAMKKYKINPSENYLAENTKVLQWGEEMTTNYQLELIARALNVWDSVAQLIARAKRLRELITERSAQLPEKELMKTARAAMNVEYRWLVTLTNAFILVDDNDTKFDPLVNKLNNNFDYIKNTILSRKKSSSSGDDSDDSDDGSDSSDDSEPSGGSDDGGSETPTT